MSTTSAKTRDENVGLTTTQAPFIEQARRDGQLFIQQPYELYSEANQEVWRTLYRNIRPKWEKYATARFMEGVENLMLDPNAIPKLEEINQFLAPLSGFKAKAVSGYVPAYLFFDCLRTRNFPTTITIRDGRQLDYSARARHFSRRGGARPHAHASASFRTVLVRFGEVARFAASRAQSLSRRSR